MNSWVEILLVTSKVTMKKLLSDMPQRRTCCVVNIMHSAAASLGFTVASCQSHILPDLPLPLTVTDHRGSRARPSLPDPGPSDGQSLFSGFLSAFLKFFFPGTALHFESFSIQSVQFCFLFHRYQIYIMHWKLTLSSVSYLLHFSLVLSPSICIAFMIPSFHLVLRVSELIEHCILAPSTIPVTMWEFNECYQ